MNDLLPAAFPPSVIWHFHQRANGHTFLVNPFKRTRLCQSKRCTFIEVQQMKVMDANTALGTKCKGHPLGQLCSH